MNANVERNALFDNLCAYLERTILPMLDNRMDLEQFANDVVRLDSESKKFICEMLNKADFNISDLYIKEEKGEVAAETLEKSDRLLHILHLPEPADRQPAKQELFSLTKLLSIPEIYQIWMSRTVPTACTDSRPCFIPW